MKNIKTRAVIANALGQRDCAAGIKPKLRRLTYLAGYARRYEVEQKQTHYSTIGTQNEF